MTNYISAELVAQSFKRLSSRERGGKKHLERTSAILYLLAFDAACKHFEVTTLDFTPMTHVGQNHRRQFELEFSRLTMLDNSDGVLKQVTEFGKIDKNGIVPELKISSNFFSVPVKKASMRQDISLYPNRPKAPVLSMGQASTGQAWGITLYKEWQANFPKLLSEARTATPHIDLAIFLLRDHCLNNINDDFFKIINNAIKIKFTNCFSNYFETKINEERIFHKLSTNPFTTSYKSFCQNYKSEDQSYERFNNMKKDDLIKRLIYLENILIRNKLEF